MVWQQALYLVNLLCKFVPCDYNFPYPDTSLSEPQAFKDLISIGYDEKDKDNPKGSLRIGGEGWKDVSEIDYTENDPLVVITKTGKMRGFWMKVVSGRKIRAFEGIPYAEPATGYFRFSEPSPKIPWSGLIWANKKGPKCLQFSQIELKRVVGSEDCLCLNVYAPKVVKNPFKKTEAVPVKFPVMIFIHGGGFQIGSGNDYGPSYLLQQDIILVTFNYRVGVFGFMSTGDKASPGNYGLKDQALAIQWVYQNIEAYHGDPLRITIIGQEAGGASVHLQMLSLRARPFFQAGVSMSGTAFSPWVFCSKDSAKDLSKHFAKKFNCPVHSSDAIVSCLRRVDAKELAKAQIKFLDDLPLPIYLFRPVLEDVEQKEVPFIVEAPEEIYRRNLAAPFPWIAGYTEDEGLTFLLPSVFRGTIKQLRDNWNHLAPDFLDYQNIKGVDQEDVTKKINWLYFKQKTPHTATIKTFSDALSLRFTVAGVHKALQAHSTLAPTYAYMFSYNGKYNLATLAGIKPQEWGVGQGEDLFYLLNSTHFYQGFVKSDHEMILAKIMVNLFGNFASKRYPTFTLENGEDFQIWNPITDPRNMSFLLIHKKIKMIPEPYLKQSVYWESIGLPDTTPYINSTEHYKDFHYITNSKERILRGQEVPPRVYYSSSVDNSQNVLDLRGSNNSGVIEDSEVNNKEEVEEDLSRFNRNLESTTTSKPILRDDIFITSTTEIPVKTVNEESDENSVFLPAWNPFGHVPKTTTTPPPTTPSPPPPTTTSPPPPTTTSPPPPTTTSPPPPPTTTFTPETTTEPEPEIITLPATTEPYSSPLVEEDEELKHFEINQQDNNDDDDSFPSFPNLPEMPNSFNLLPPTQESLTTTTIPPEVEDSPEVEKFELDFKQDPFYEEEDHSSTTTESPQTNELFEFPNLLDSPEKTSNKRQNKKVPEYSTFPFITDDNEPYNIMK